MRSQLRLPTDRRPTFGISERGQLLRSGLGETAVVTGTVDAVRVTSTGLTLVNLDGRYPDQALIVVVKPERTKAVGDFAGLEGKTIVVRSTITEFKGKPQIEITTKDAISEVKK